MADKTLEQAVLAALFGEIAALALDAIEASRHVSSPHEDPDQALRLEVQLVRALEHVGWLADMGSKRAGGVTMQGGAQEWLLSPATRSALSEVDCGKPQ